MASSDSKDLQEKLESKERQRLAGLRHHRIKFEDAIDYATAERVYEINDKDIILGRGKGNQNRPGNKRMRKLVEKHKAHYHTLNRGNKQKLLKQIYEDILEGDSRFLKKIGDEEVWVVIDAPICIQKISHTMRSSIYATRKLRESTGSHALLDGRILENEGESSRYARYPTQIAVVDPDMNLRSRILDELGKSGFIRSHESFGLLPSSNQLSDLDARHRLAGLDRYRALASEQLALETINYQRMIQQDRLIREMMIYQRMADNAAIMNSAMAFASPALPLLPLANSLALASVGSQMPLNPLAEGALQENSHTVLQESSHIPNGVLSNHNRRVPDEVCSRIPDEIRSFGNSST
jgi:hypothetical protein